MGVDIPPPPILPADLKASITAKRKSHTTDNSYIPPPLPADLKASITAKRKSHTTDSSYIPPPILPADLKASIIAKRKPHTSEDTYIPPPILPADLKASITAKRKSHTTDNSYIPPPILPADLKASITAKRKPHTVGGSYIPPPPLGSHRQVQVVTVQEVEAETRQEFVFPGFTAGSTVDIVSQRALQHAFDLELSYITAVNALVRCFHRPLRAALGRLAEKDLAAVFNGVEMLCGTAGDVARKIIAVARAGRPFFLLSVYMSCKAYMAAYRAFLKVHEAGLFQLNTLQLTSEGFCKALAGCTPPAGPTLNDLFWLVAARFKHIYKIAQTQYVYCKSFYGLLRSVEGSVQFDTERMVRGNASSAGCCCEDAADKALEAMVPSDEESKAAEEDLKRIHETQPFANRLAGIHESMGFVRRIHCKNREIASSLKRKLLETMNVSLQHSRTFGLSFVQPALLFFFNDGLALCTPYRGNGDNANNSARYSYELATWYPAQELCAMKLIPKNFTEIGFKISRKVLFTPPALISSMTQAQLSRSQTSQHQLPFLSQSLGQQQQGGGLQQHQGGSQLSQSQQTTTTAAAAAAADMGDNALKGEYAYEDMRTVLVDSAETYNSCLRLFKEVSGRETIEEVPPVPFQMIGVPLETLVANERGLYANRSRVPVLVRFLLDYITAHGISEKGVFRVTVEKNQIEKLAQRVNTMDITKIDWDRECSRAVCALLKLFLRDMPTPLIPQDLHDSFVQSVKIDPLEARVAAYVQLVDAIRPRVHRTMLTQLIRFLDLVMHNSHFNSMNSKNLAIVTAPSILWKSGSTEDIIAITNSNLVIEFLIDNYDKIFNNNNSIKSNTSSLSMSSSSSSHVNDDEDGKEDGGWVGLRRKLLGHNAPVVATARTPDGTHIVSIDENGMAILWDTATVEYVKEVPLGLGQGTSAAAFAGGSDSSANLWVVTQDKICLFDAQTFEPRGAVPVVCSTVITAAGGAEVWCGCEGGVTVVSAATRAVTANMSTGSSAVVTHIAADDERGKVWGSGWDPAQDHQHIYVWDRATGKLLADIPAHTGRINALRVCLGSVYSCSDDLTVGVWDPLTHASLKTIAGHKGPVLDICPVPAGPRPCLWTCSADKTILIWDPTTHKKLGVVKGYHSKEVTAMVPIKRTENTTDVWSASADMSFCIWDVSPSILN